MRALPGCIRPDRDPEFVPAGGVQSEDVGRASIAGIDRARYRRAVSTVHQQTRARAGVGGGGE